MRVEEPEKEPTADIVALRAALVWLVLVTRNIACVISAVSLKFINICLF
jgi:hypothetical protein